jgi:hypothetical protein
VRSFILYFVLFFLSFTVLSGEEEYSFDIESIKKTPFKFGGYLEFRPVLSVLDVDSASYKLRFFNRYEGRSVSEYNFNALMDLSYEKGIFKTMVRTNSLITKSFEGWAHNTSLYEAFLSVKPSNSVSLEIGKKRLKWGKGYAWNPVAFIDRSKNPNDPELALEGFTVATLNYIKSFQGKLKTISFTVVLLPVKLMRLVICLVSVSSQKQTLHFSWNIIKTDMVFSKEKCRITIHKSMRRTRFFFSPEMIRVLSLFLLTPTLHTVHLLQCGIIFTSV